MLMEKFNKVQSLAKLVFVIWCVRLVVLSWQLVKIVVGYKEFGVTDMGYLLSGATSIGFQFCLALLMISVIGLFKAVICKKEA